MNQNRPFYATNTNCYDQSFRSTAPTTLNGENVILSQEQQRRVCDTLNTSIVGNPFGIASNQPMLWAQKQYFPGGVMFTFPPAQMGPQNISQGGCCKCNSVPTQNSMPIEFSHFNQAPVAVNTFFPSSMEYQQAKACGVFGYQQQPPTEQFQLKFHHNRGTSSSDLLGYNSQVPPSQGLPDLSNITGALEQKQACSKPCQFMKESLFPSPPVEFSSNAKRLILSEIVTPPSGHVVDVLDESGKDENKKKVSFSDPNEPTTGEKGSQITSECICDAKKCKNKTKAKKKKKEDDKGDSKKDKPKKKKGKTKGEAPSESSPSSDCEDPSSDPQQKQKQKNRRWWNHEKKTENGSSETHSSDSEAEKSDPKRHKKRKNKKKKQKINNHLEVKLKDNESQTDDISTASDSERESCHC